MVIGKDFDFYGSTAKVANAINEEQIIFSRQATKKKVTTPKPAAAKPPPAIVRSPEPIPDLQPEMSLWTNQGIPQNQQIPAHHYRPQAVDTYPPAPKKFMSLEEVEAQILAQSQKPTQQPQTPAVPQIRQLPPISEPPQLQQYHPDHHLFHGGPLHNFIQHGTPPPTQFLQEHRHSPQPPAIFSQVPPPPHLAINQIQNVPAPLPILPKVPQTEAERAKLMEEESKRLKRNHKIAQLVR